MFADILAETNARTALATGLVETLEGQIGNSAKTVTPEMVETFAALVRDRLRAHHPALRKAYLGPFVSKVAVSQEQILISGSNRMLEHAVGKAEPVIMDTAPIFYRKWCPWPLPVFAVHNIVFPAF